MFENPKIDSYANALLEIAKETKNVENYTNQVNQIHDILKYDQKLIQVVGNSQINSYERKELLDNIFSKKDEFDPKIISFLKILVDNNAFLFVKQILKRFLELVDEMEGIEFVKVYTTYLLSAEELEKLKLALQKKTNLKKIKIKNIVSPELICGVKIVSKFFTIDNSLKSKIGLMLKKFMK